MLCVIGSAWNAQTNKRSANESLKVEFDKEVIGVDCLRSEPIVVFQSKRRGGDPVDQVVAE